MPQPNASWADGIDALIWGTDGIDALIPKTTPDILGRVADAVELIRSWARRAPLSIPLGRWVKIWLSSIVLGGVVYTSLLFWAYSSVRHSLLNAPPTEVQLLSTKSFIPGPAPACQTSTKIAKLYGAAFSIADDKTIASLAKSFCIAPSLAVGSLPAITVVESFVREDRQCGGQGCSLACAEYWRNRVARLLGGSLLSGEIDLGATPQPPTRLSGEVAKPGDAASNQKCEIAEPLFVRNRLVGLIRKPTPISAPEAARWLLGLEQCVGDSQDSCLLVTRMLQSALDNPRVRSSRTFVN